MPEPLLTIVTINRNHASGLARTIDSLRPLRAESSVQFVFIDGASTDESLDVARTFYRSEEIISEPDAGIYDAMNKGLGLALGTYVIWINSGDEWHPSAWPSAIQVLSNTNATLIACGYEYISVGSAQPSRIYFSQDARFPESSFCHQAVFFKRAKAVEHGGYSLDYAIVSDRALILRMHLASEPIEFAPLLVARVEAGGVSANNFARELDNYRVDRDLGLISARQFRLGVARHHALHRIAYPAWLTLMRIVRITGFASPAKPTWLRSLVGQPERFRMYRH